MERITSDQPIPGYLRGSIMALGNFDGFHAGHQAVVGRAIEQARGEGRPAIVATFDPHPIRLFRPDAPHFRISSLDQRERLFGEAGADAMMVFRFDAGMAALSAEQFVDMLCERFGVAGVVTGEDFTFGKGRSGNIAALRELGDKRGMSAQVVQAVRDGGGGVVSSSRIRAALTAGDCATAAQMLTRPFAIRGEVIHGDKRGRTIGYPTANMEMGEYVRPAYGIYAVQATLPDGRVIDGAANLGIRPTFDPPKELLETFLLDFAGDLYGQTIEIALIERLRGEEKFDGLDALVAQMDRDVARVRMILHSGR